MKIENPTGTRVKLSDTEKLNEEADTMAEQMFRKALQSDVIDRRYNFHKAWKYAEVYVAGNHRGTYRRYNFIVNIPAAMTEVRAECAVQRNYGPSDDGWKWRPLSCTVSFSKTLAPMWDFYFTIEDGDLVATTR